MSRPRITAVTTYSDEGWRQYGEQCVATWQSLWPGKIITFDDRQIEAMPGFGRIKMASCAWPVLRGMVGHVYDWNYDVLKFSRKTFAVAAAAEMTDGLLFWIDSDVEMTRRPQRKFLERLLDGYTTCYLGRESMHSELGFCGFDLADKNARILIERWRDCYITGEALLTGTGWNDCWLYDVLINSPQIRAHNMTFNGAKGLEAFGQSPLKDYMVHHKGPLAKEGFAA